jgi:hypothetical protein
MNGDAITVDYWLAIPRPSIDTARAVRPAIANAGWRGMTRVTRDGLESTPCGCSTGEDK